MKARDERVALMNEVCPVTFLSGLPSCFCVHARFVFRLHRSLVEFVCLRSRFFIHRSQSMYWCRTAVHGLGAQLRGPSPQDTRKRTQIPEAQLYNRGKSPPPATSLSIHPKLCNLIPADSLECYLVWSWCSGLSWNFIMLMIMIQLGMVHQF